MSKVAPSEQPNVRKKLTPSDPSPLLGNKLHPPMIFPHPPSEILKIRPCNAVLDVFPGIKGEGCFFHLCNWLDFQVKRLGLMTKYQTDDDFKLRVKMSALAFVPVSDVVATTFLPGHNLPQ